jgi:hypothetical protein
VNNPFNAEAAELAEKQCTPEEPSREITLNAEGAEIAEKNYLK